MLPTGCPFEVRQPKGVHILRSLGQARFQFQGKLAQVAVVVDEEVEAHGLPMAEVQREGGAASQDKVGRDLREDRPKRPLRGGKNVSFGLEKLAY